MAKGEVEKESAGVGVQGQDGHAIGMMAQDSALDPAMMMEMIHQFQGEKSMLSDDEVSP